MNTELEKLKAELDKANADYTQARIAVRNAQSCCDVAADNWLAAQKRYTKAAVKYEHEQAERERTYSELEGAQ